MTLARYAILVEAVHEPALREHVAATGGRVNTLPATGCRYGTATSPR